MSKGRIFALIDKAKRFWKYCAHGVWADTRPKFSVNLIKTLNITVRSFLNTDIQSKACAMTYRTMLAVVPALALVFAIGRGFGFQNLLQDELYNIFPSQKQAVTHALQFVDSYLNQASEGIFIGIGIIFLLYTIITLMINMENCFNQIWNIRQRRGIGRKLTDYTAMLLILPVLMICGGGFAMFLSTTLQKVFHFSFMTPILSFLFEVGSFLFTCLFFTAIFMLFPNTKVKFRNALMSGFITGLGFTFLQWLFVSGQMYVSRYNAIYGSFSFLPLFLLWLQMVWVVILSGSLICYASQNVFQFSFTDQINQISEIYYDKVTIAIATAIVQRFLAKMSALTVYEIIENYGIPSRLVTNVLDKLEDVGLVSRVVIDEKHQIFGYQPAVDPSEITVNLLRHKMQSKGSANFIPNFNENFKGVVEAIDDIEQAIMIESKDQKLSEIKITAIK